MTSLLFRDRPAAGRRTHYSTSDPTKVPAPGDVTAGAMYHYDSLDAFKIAACIACFGLRAGAMAQLPIAAYEGDEPGALLLDPPSLISTPSEAVVRSVWKTQMSISRDAWGWAAGLITAVDGAGYPAHAEWLLPDEQVTAVEHGLDIEWRVGREPIDASRILHVPSRWVLPGRPLGMAPLEKSGLVDLARKAQEFGRDWFINGAVPSSIIYSEDPDLTEGDADGIVKTILAKWRTRKPAVLGSSFKYETISVPANESQFLETMRQAQSDIAKCFNLPAAEIDAAMSSGSQIQYANLTQNTQRKLMDSINPDLVVVQETLERHMPPGVRLRWKTGAFLRSDLKTRYESHEIGIRAGFLTVDEARALEELPPLKTDTDGGAE